MLKKNLSQNKSRILFIVFSLCIFLPMPVASLLFMHNDEPRGIHNPGLLLFIIVVYLVLEFIEYKKYHYASGKKILLLMFAIRLCLWLTLIIFYIFEEAVFLNIILTPLIAYYAYFCFPSPVSISFCCLLVFHEVWINFFFNTETADKAGGFSVMILFLVVKMVFILFFQIYARFWERDKKIQSANENLMADLQGSHKQLQNYAKQIADVVALEERNRLARDIHDSLGHYLAAINIQLAKAEAFFERDSSESLKALHDAKQAAVEAMEDVRESVQALSRKKQIPFWETIDKIIDRIDKNAYAIDYIHKGEPDGFNYSVLITLYRVIQEGITNIFKHSKADRIYLEIEFRDEEVKLRLKDNGRGFDAGSQPDNMAAKKSGFGLNSLRERLELVQGCFSLKSEPGKGTELEVTAPKDPIKIFIGRGM